MTPDNHKQTRESALVAFAREYGWRAYALPVLAVITVWVFVDIFFGSPEAVEDSAAHSTTHANQTMKAPIPGDQTRPNLAMGELPPGPDYTKAGTGKYRTVGNPGEKVGKGEESTFTYAVQVEEGVDTVAYGGDDAVAAMIDATLSNPKGWIGDSRFAFQHVDAATQTPDLLIQLTSIDSTHAACGHDLEMETSCFTDYGGTSRVVLNESRWVRGAAPFMGDLGAYRQYLINHEVGHAIGFAAHVPCPAQGQLAPIMMQQTLSLDNAELHKLDPNEVYPDNDDTCQYNPWPYPFN